MWRTIKRLWVGLGLAATIGLFGWSLIAYRASGEAKIAAQGDAAVHVTRSDRLWRFTPERDSASNQVGMLFFPGALVDPVAYAPLARDVARAGFATIILPLPRRGAFGGADDPSLLVRAESIMSAGNPGRRWVVAGHSRGAVVATQLAAARPKSIAGLVLIGTTHPRDVDLSALTVPVAKIVGSRDGIAKLADAEANRHLLPDSVRWVHVEGGNHSQFGWYGFQPFDRRPKISAGLQREIMLSTVLELVQSIEQPPYRTQMVRLGKLPRCYRIAVGPWRMPAAREGLGHRVPEIIELDSVPESMGLFTLPWRELSGIPPDSATERRPISGMWRAPPDSLIVSFSGGFGGLGFDFALRGDSLRGGATISNDYMAPEPTAPATGVSVPCRGTDPSG